MRALVDLGPLREHRPFRRLWLGTTASGLGGQLTTFAVAFSVWEATRNPFYVGLIGLSAAVPLIVLALAGGAFIDHLDRVRLARLTTLGQIATSVLLAVAAMTEQVWAMFALTAVAAGLSAIGAPARRAIVAQMLPTPMLAAGLALNHLSFQLAMLLGPALAGLITAQWGAPVCLALDALTFTAALAGLRGLSPAGPQATTRIGPQSAGNLLPHTESATPPTAGNALPHPESGAPPTTGNGPPHPDSSTPPTGRARLGWAAILDGLRFAARTPTVRAALLCDLCATLLAMPVALFPVINQEKFGGSPQVLGLFLTSVAVGGIIASALSGLITRGSRPGVVLLACAAVWGGALALVGVADQLPVVLALLAVAGGADTWAVVSRGTVVQASTPDTFRGRIASLEHVVGVAGPELGNVRAGTVGALTSGGTSLLAGGLACVAAIALVAWRNPRLRGYAHGGGLVTAENQAAATT